MGKTKVPISGLGLDVLQKSDKDIWGMGPKGIRKNAIFSCGCFSWIHKNCSGILGRLKSDANFRCKRCTGQVRPIDVRLMTDGTLGREKLEVVPSFCYLGHCLVGWLWTRYYRKMPCRIGQIQRVPAHPHLQLISNHLQRKSLQFVFQECHVLCKWNLAPTSSH